jgi:hypothetical protein
MTGGIGMKLSLKIPARFPAREPRASVDIQATLLLPDDGVAPVAIRNISAEGFMGETPIALGVGDAIGVALPGCGIVRASVRWARHGEIGAQFRGLLDLDRLQHGAPDDDSVRTLFESRLVQGPL